MKKFLDLVLVLLVLGAPILIFGVLPDRGGSSTSQPTPSAEGPRPELPLPPNDTRPGPPVPEVDTGTTAEATSDTGSDRTPTPTIDRVPDPPVSGVGLQVAGASYRGASNPLPGAVLATANATDPADWIAERDGSFRTWLGAGDLRLLGPSADDAMTVAFPIPASVAATGAPALLNVHRFFRDDPDELFTPVSALVIQCEAIGPPVLLVRGRTALPDGAELAVRVLAIENTLESMVLRVRGGEFGGVLRFSDRQYHSGSYDLQFAWGPRLANQRTMLALADTRWASIEGEVQRDLGIFLGTPDDAAEQEREIRRYFREALQELEGARDFLQVVSAQARRKRNTLLDDPARVARMRNHEFADLHDGLFDGRKLVIRKWRDLIDEAVPALVAKYLDADAMPFPTRSRRAAHNLVEVAKRVGKLSKLESILVYKALGLEPDPKNYVAGCEFPPDIERTLTLEQMENCIEAVREAIEH